MRRSKISRRFFSNFSAGGTLTAASGQGGLTTTGLVTSVHNKERDKLKEILYLIKVNKFQSFGTERTSKARLASEHCFERANYLERKKEGWPGTGSGYILSMLRPRRDDPLAARPVLSCEVCFNSAKIFYKDARLKTILHKRLTRATYALLLSNRQRSNLM